MSYLQKLSLRTFEKVVGKDPIAVRRGKLIAAINTQKLVLAAALKGETYTLPSGKTADEQTAASAKTVRPWFFEQDGGWYVQCRYGARPLLIDGKNNAVFVKKLDEVDTVLTAFTAAVQAGELDQAIANAAQSKKG